MPLLWVLVIVLLVLALTGGYGYHAGWNGPYYFGGAGLLGIVLLVLIVLLLMGRI